MARVLALSCICFLLAATAASARSLQQAPAPAAAAATAAGVPSLAAAVKAAGVKPNVSLFVDAFDQAGIVRSVSNITALWTLLIPTNEAVITALPLLNITLEDYASGQMTKQEQARVSAIVGNIIEFHILPEGAFTAENLGIADGLALTPLLTLKSRIAGDLMVAAPAGGNVTFTSDRVLANGRNSTATVIAPDVKAGNGILHVIDAVLIPPVGAATNVTVGA